MNCRGAGIDTILAAGREAVRRHPEHPSPHAMLGTALLVLGRRDEAVGALRAAIQRHQTWVQATAQAVATQGGISSTPIDPVAQELGPVGPDTLHVLLGIALRDRGDFAGALAEFRAADEVGVIKETAAYLVARTEPMARLAGRLDAVLKGVDRPTDGENLRTFASMACHVGHYAAAGGPAGEGARRVARPLGRCGDAYQEGGRAVECSEDQSPPRTGR